MEDNLEVREKPQTTKEFLKSRNFLKPFLGIVIGGVAGFLYYHYVGCSSGSCAINGNPFMSTAYGSMLGLFLVKSPCVNGKC